MSEITEEYLVGDSPGDSTGVTAPEIGEVHRVSSDLKKEYVSAGEYQWYRNVLQVLPFNFDDLTASLGRDIYDKMMVDPQIESCVNALRTAIISSGLKLGSASAPDASTSVDFDDSLALRTRNFCEQVVDQLEDPIEDILWGMLEAMVHGSKIAEQIYEDRMIDGILYLALKNLKIKARDHVAFVVDNYKNIIGVVALIPGVSYSLSEGSMILTTPANMLPRSKFFIYTFRPRDSDPRGTSIIRSSYNAWWTKMQIWPELLRFLALFAMPALIGTTPENAGDKYEIDPDTGEAIPGTRESAQEAMLKNLLEIKNGSAAAFPFGAKVITVGAEGTGGNIFMQAISTLDKQMSKGITGQTLATEEAEHQARASSTTQMTVLQTVVRQIKRSLERAFYRDVLKPLVLYNFGEEALKYTPKPSLGEVDQADLTSLAIAVAQLKNAEYLDPSQMVDLDRKMGLSARSPIELQARYAMAGVQSTPMVQPIIDNIEIDDIEGGLDGSDVLE